jgi:cell fate regulator YaaT (PSP1 superfamily)
MNIVGIRFKRFSKTYYFDPAGIELAMNEMVIVETARGLELGQVVVAPKDLPDDQVPEPLKPVIRKAEAADTSKAHDLEIREKEALSEGARMAVKLNLPMKLISADYNLDGSRVTVYFSAEERIDFRELVREMAGRLRTRVELRQIGPRDEAKLIGGYGRCGRQLCCRSFLNELVPVSMRMAKDQGLPLNPMKISGCCGRLMCCLGYECQQYRDMRKELPRENSRVITASGPGKVVGVNPLRGTATVLLDESHATTDLPASELTLEKPREPERQPDKGPVPEPAAEPEAQNQAPGGSAPVN